MPMFFSCLTHVKGKKWQGIFVLKEIISNFGELIIKLLNEVLLKQK